MKLDLLYEIDTPYPWPDLPHPYDQRTAEQRAYREAFEQIRLADTVRFHTVWMVQLPHESVMHGIELLGKEVIPVMETYEPKR